MRKILFATSALVGATAIASSALAGGTHAVEQAKPNAGALTVMVGGQIDFQGGFTDEAIPGQRSGRFANDTEIHVQVSGSTDSFDYGAVIELNADIDADANADGGNADKAFIFVENDGFGRVELGGNAGASETLEVDASNIARATGGVDGDWHRYVNTAAFGTALRPNLPSTSDWADSDAQKITYYTPRFSGVQLGASYIIDTNSGSTTAVPSVVNDAGYADVFTGGINYEGNINENVGIEAALVGEYGRAEATAANVAREDLRAWSAGLGVNFSGFSLAGNYADLGDSGTTAAASADTTYWTLGAAYENGPFGLSATYLSAETENNVAPLGTTELQLLSFGADYQLAPGFVPYVEANFYDADTAGVGDNGNVILVGTELTF